MSPVRPKKPRARRETCPYVLSEREELRDSLERAGKLRPKKEQCPYVLAEREERLEGLERAGGR